MLRGYLLVKCFSLRRSFFVILQVEASNKTCEGANGLAQFVTWGKKSKIVIFKFYELDILF